MEVRPEHSAQGSRKPTATSLTFPKSAHLQGRYSRERLLLLSRALDRKLFNREISRCLHCHTAASGALSRCRTLTSYPCRHTEVAAARSGSAPRRAPGLRARRRERCSGAAACGGLEARGGHGFRACAREGRLMTHLLHSIHPASAAWCPARCPQCERAQPAATGHSASDTCIFLTDYYQ